MLLIFHISFSDLQAGNPNKTGDKYSLPIELCPTADAASVEGASRLSPLTILWELEEMTQLQWLYSVQKLKTVWSPFLESCFCLLGFARSLIICLAHFWVIHWLFHNNIWSASVSSVLSSEKIVSQLHLYWLKAAAAALTFPRDLQYVRIIAD